VSGFEITVERSGEPLFRRHAADEHAARRVFQRASRDVCGAYVLPPSLAAGYEVLVASGSDPGHAFRIAARPLPAPPTVEQES